MRIGSLFAGIGGIDLGFEQAGFEVVWANEIDKKARETYEENFKGLLYEEDIKLLQGDSLPSVDIITGGFPSQAFSQAGKQKGFDDARGSLVFELLRIVGEVKPKAIFFENVKNLLTHNNGESVKEIIKQLNGLGYSVKMKVLNTCEYSNLPQNRERLYIVGFLDKSKTEAFCFPGKIKDTLKITELVDNLGDFWSYYSEDRYSTYYPMLREAVTSRETVYQIRRTYVRENKRGLCPTLTANMGTGGHNVPIILDTEGIRALTPRECANFQGFPKEFIFSRCYKGKAPFYKQIGNSVSVPVIKNIAIEIKKVLEK